MSSKRWYWECPVCHARVPRNMPDEIESHKGQHSDNPRAFNPNHPYDTLKEIQEAVNGK